MMVDRVIATSSEQIEQGKTKTVPAAPEADAVRGAHRVLMSCLPNASLPTDLIRLRGMLDKQMFGRDRRALRDDAVRVAWQIDSLPSVRAR